MQYRNVSKFFDRHGKLRWRFRRKGLPTVMLPGPFGSPEFIAAFEAAANGRSPDIGAKRSLPGSISALVAGYYQSSDYKGLGESTRKNYRGVLERFRAKNGDKPLSALTPENVRAKMDKMASTPSSANILRKCLRALCRFGLDRKLIKVDPMMGVKPLRIKSDGHATWTEEQIAQFEARHPLGTKANLALKLLLYTAQRRSDVVTLGRQHMRDNVLVLRQQKTGERLIIPIVSGLKIAIDATPARGLTFLETDYGKPFSPAGFGNWFFDRVREAGLVGVSAHGLRKSASRRLAEAGKTAHEIMSLTGHKTLSEVQRYTRAADQERLARGASDGLGGGMNSEPSVGKPDNRFANSVPNPLIKKG